MTDLERWIHDQLVERLTLAEPGVGRPLGILKGSAPAEPPTLAAFAEAMGWDVQPWQRRHIEALLAMSPGEREVRFRAAERARYQNFRLTLRSEGE